MGKVLSNGETNRPGKNYCKGLLESLTAIGSVVISRERFERELCLPGWLSSNIIRGPTLPENDRHLCMWDEHIRRDSCQNFSRRSVTKSEHYRHYRVSRPQFPRPTNGTPGTMTPLLETKTLAFYDLGFPTEARVKMLRYLRVNSCKYRKWDDSLEILEFFIFCPNNLYSELFSKIPFKGPEAL